MFFVRKSCGSNRTFPEMSRETLTLAGRPRNLPLDIPDEIRSWKVVHDVQLDQGLTKLGSYQLQVRVPLDQFLCAIILKAHGQLAILAFALHFNDGADAILRMAHARPNE